MGECTGCLQDWMSGCVHNRDGTATKDRKESISQRRKPLRQAVASPYNGERMEATVVTQSKRMRARAHWCKMHGHEHLLQKDVPQQPLDSAVPVGQLPQDHPMSFENKDDANTLLILIVCL